MPASPTDARYGSTIRGGRPSSSRRAARACSRLYSKPHVVRDAIASRAERQGTDARMRADQVAAADAELAKTEAALARYMAAFERGSISDEAFAGRVRDLQAKATTLRHPGPACGRSGRR